MTKPAPTGSSWTITSQSRTVQARNGQLVDGYMIYYVTGDGHPGQVFVPMTSYTPDKVKTIIAADAANVDAVGALSSDAGD